jgi:hypothetical protein
VEVAADYPDMVVITCCCPQCDGCMQHRQQQYKLQLGKAWTDCKVMIQSATVGWRESGGQTGEDAANPHRRTADRLLFSPLVGKQRLEKLM